MKCRACAGEMAEAYTREVYKGPLTKGWICHNIACPFFGIILGEEAEKVKASNENKKEKG